MYDTTNPDETDAQTTEQDALNPDEVLDYDPDDADAAELGEHIAKTCRVLVEEVGFEGGQASVKGMDVGFLVNMAIPSVEGYAAKNPGEALQAVARLHLETQALLDYHAPDRDPEDLL